jgi:hypothetical protein
MPRATAPSVDADPLKLGGRPRGRRSSRHDTKKVVPSERVRKVLAVAEQLELAPAERVELADELLRSAPEPAQEAAEFTPEWTEELRRIAFTSEDGTLGILAVVHGSRSPAYWRSRMRLPA